MVVSHHFPITRRFEVYKCRRSSEIGLTRGSLGSSYSAIELCVRVVWYDGAIMMAKTQITLETEMQRRARRRANDLGVSLAEYFRRLLARDLARPETAAHVDRIFDLGASGGSDIASHKDSMIAEAFRSTRRKPRRR